MHVSNEYNELVDDEIFPVQVSRQTYLYVQNLLRERGRYNHYRLTVKDNGAITYVDTDRIQYVQALGRECILHLVNEKRQVQTSIKELAAELPSSFCRIHRSYFVNCNFVAKVERYKLTLVQGEELPIPKMRYMEVRDELAEMIRVMQTKRKNPEEQG